MAAGRTAQEGQAVNEDPQKDEDQLNDEIEEELGDLLRRKEG